MKRIITSVLTMMLLVILLSTFAFADVHPAQMGDVGGANAAKLEAELLQKNTGGFGQYVPPTPQTGFDPDYEPEINYQINPYGEQGGQIFTQNPGSNNTAGSQPPTTTTQNTSASGGVNTLDWFSVGFDLINANKNITIYDTQTGTTWNAKYINGKNHADIIPASSGDATLIANKKITGSYVRRPVVVTIAGAKYAGSMYAVGHGSKSYCNYFKGVMCIHFTGSKTHSSNKVDKDHQAAIQQAAGGN